MSDETLIDSKRPWRPHILSWWYAMSAGLLSKAFPENESLAFLAIGVMGYAIGRVVEGGIDRICKTRKKRIIAKLIAGFLLMPVTGWLGMVI